MLCEGNGIPVSDFLNFDQVRIQGEGGNEKQRELTDDIIILKFQRQREFVSWELPPYIQTREHLIREDHKQTGGRWSKHVSQSEFTCVNYLCVQLN